MVAPSLALNLITPTFTGYPQANVITNLPGVGNYSANNNQLRFNCDTTSGQTYFVELIFPGGAINATDTLWCAHFQTNFGTNTGKIGLGSGAGNYQYWQGTNNTGYGNNFRTLELIFDTRRPPIDAAVGAFNIAAVDRIRFEFEAATSITNATGPIFYGIPFYWAPSDGMGVVGGDASNPLGFADLFDLRNSFIDRLLTFQITYFNNFAGTDNVQLAIPLVEGDATTTHLAPDGFLLFSLREINSSGANFIDTNLVESSYKARFTGLTVFNRSFQTNDLPYSWADEGGGNTWRRLNISGASNASSALCPAFFSDSDNLDIALLLNL